MQWTTPFDGLLENLPGAYSDHTFLSLINRELDFLHRIGQLISDEFARIRIFSASQTPFAIGAKWPALTARQDYSGVSTRMPPLDVYVHVNLLYTHECSQTVLLQQRDDVGLVLREQKRNRIGLSPSNAVLVSLLRTAALIPNSHTHWTTSHHEQISV